MATPYINFGNAIDDFGGLRLDLRQVSGLDSLLCDLAARLLGSSEITEEIEEGYGFDLQQFVYDTIDSNTLSYIEDGVKAQLLRDPRVESITVDGSYIDDTLTLIIQGVPRDSDTTFSFVTKMSQTGYPTFKRNY